MSKLSNSALLKIFTKLLILLALAKAISLALWWYLPSDGVELNIKENYQPKYQRVDFKNMLENGAVEVENKEQTTDTSNSINITNMILKGLYGNAVQGYAIVSLKSNAKKTTIIELGEKFSGYTLKEILIDSAIFTKGSKEYILSLEKPKKGRSSISKVSKTVESGDTKNVSRSDIMYYSKHPKEIWKDISITELKEHGKIKGFKVIKVREKSKFASLGLQKGDLIIRANNVELKSYRDALNIYKNISKIETMQIVVMRNNQEVELVYEIN